MSGGSDVARGGAWPIGSCPLRRGSQVVRQGTANPPSRVRFPSPPLSPEARNARESRVSPGFRLFLGDTALRGFDCQLSPEVVNSGHICSGAVPIWPPKRPRQRRASRTSSVQASVVAPRTARDTRRQARCPVAGCHPRRHRRPRHDRHNRSTRRYRPLHRPRCCTARQLLQPTSSRGQPARLKRGPSAGLTRFREG